MPNGLFSLLGWIRETGEMAGMHPGKAVVSLKKKKKACRPFGVDEGTNPSFSSGAGWGHSSGLVIEARVTSLGFGVVGTLLKQLH